jgi:hypothetical protein
MIRPNIACLIKQNDGYDINGHPQYKAEVRVKCRIVHYKIVDEKTSVRADSSASRGRADERVFDVTLLFPRDTVIDIESQVTLYRKTFKVESIEPRFSTTAKLDHIEVMLNQWA